MLTLALIILNLVQAVGTEPTPAPYTDPTAACVPRMAPVSRADRQGGRGVQSGGHFRHLLAIDGLGDIKPAMAYIHADSRPFLLNSGLFR